MFREMRRSRQALPYSECLEILNEATSGVLAVAGDKGYPYAVPLSFVYVKDKIYFHCAKTGHKLDAIGKCPKVSFCVISQDKIVPDEFTTYYKSVIVFGKAAEITEPQEFSLAINALAAKYSPLESIKKVNDEINRFFHSLNVVGIEVEHISGKQAKELVSPK